MKASLVKRVDALEERLKPSGLDLPPFDFDLLTACEKEYFSLEMTVLRQKARELEYADKNTRVGWFDLRNCDPVFDDEVRAECLAALNAEEAKAVETYWMIIEKCLRLTAVLSEEEKKDVKHYNHVALYFENSLIRNCEPNAYSHDDLLRARQGYEETMARHGEVTYERPLSTEVC